MQRRRFSAALVSLLLLAVACTADTAPPAAPRGGDGAGDGLTDLSAEELGWLAASLPGAVRQRVVPIPEALLSEDDLDAENTAVLELYDAAGELVGYARDVFTDVACNGSCRAIRFMLVFDARLAFLDVFHQPELSHDFMKYWQDEYSAFTTEDRALLKSLLASPPEELVAVTDPSTLAVDASVTAATEPAYQDVVVRGAAFTTYIVLMVRIDTQALLEAMTTD